MINGKTSFCVLAVAAVTIVAGCSASSNALATPANVDLTITTSNGLSADTTGEALANSTTRIVCSSSEARVEGYLPKTSSAEEICAEVGKLTALLLDKPSGGMTTTSWYGPEKAIVKGSLGGVEVSRTFSRSSGSRLREWDMIGSLLRGSTVESTLPALDVIR